MTLDSQRPRTTSLALPTPSPTGDHPATTVKYTSGGPSTQNPLAISPSPRSSIGSEPDQSIAHVSAYSTEASPGSFIAPHARLYTPRRHGRVSGYGIGRAVKYSIGPGLSVGQAVVEPSEIDIRPSYLEDVPSKIDIRPSCLENVPSEIDVRSSYLEDVPYEEDIRPSYVEDVPPCVTTPLTTSHSSSYCGQPEHLLKGQVHLEGQLEGCPDTSPDDVTGGGGIMINAAVVALSIVGQKVGH